MNTIPYGVLAVALSIMAPAAGTTVVYKYTGAVLDVTTTFDVPVASPTRITGEFVASGPLGGTDPLGGTLIFDLNQFTSWSFSDGVKTFTNQTASDPRVSLSVASSFTFGPSGQVATWFISLNEQPTTIPGMQDIMESTGSLPSFGPPPCLRLVDLPPNCYADDGQSFFETGPPGIGFGGAVAASVTGGQWSGPLLVPEPRTLLLMTVGLALAGSRRVWARRARSAF